jgi:hypothetical protein
MHFTIGHLKFFLETPRHQQKVSITTTTTGADIRMTIPDATKVRILINARVETNPDQLQQLVCNALMKAQRLFNCSITSGEWAAFKPGFPKPVHRIAT